MCVFASQKTSTIIYAKSYYINSEVTDYYVGLRFSCARLTPQKMSPTQYARTVRCTDEVMCYCVWYGTVRYGECDRITRERTDLVIGRV